MIKKPFVGGSRLLSVVSGVSLFLVQNASANIVGTDAQNFNPITSGIDFVTVQSSETLNPGIINLGLFFNYSLNTLPRYGAANNTSDSLIGSDLNFGIGILKNWDFGVNVPILLYHNDPSTSSGSGGLFSSNGVMGLRMNTKVRFFGDNRHGLATILSSTFNLIENNPNSGRGSSPAMNLELAYDHTFGKVAAAINIGYRWLNPGSQINPVVVPTRNQLIGSLAANYSFEKAHTKIIAEVFGAIPAVPVGTEVDRQMSSFEALLGVKHDFSNQVAGHLGLGRELVDGAASPDLRVYAGVNVALGPVWKKKPAHYLETVAPTAGAVAAFVTRDLHFLFDTAEIIEDYRPVLDELVEHLKKDGYKQIVIEGHTDSIGKLEYNQALSESRAEKVKSVLVSVYKIDVKKIKAVGYSDTRPIDDNSNYQGRQRNRRVEFKIYR